MGNGNIGRIGNLHLVLLHHSSLLHIHIINPDTILIFLAHRISGHICHIFILVHHFPPS